MSVAEVADPCFCIDSSECNGADIHNRMIRTMSLTNHALLYRNQIANVMRGQHNCQGVKLSRSMLHQ